MWYPLCFSIPAREAIPVPQIPMRWMWRITGGRAFKAGDKRESELGVGF
jgi:hypothetical protein